MAVSTMTRRGANAGILASTAIAAGPALAAEEAIEGKADIAIKTR